MATLLPPATIIREGSARDLEPLMAVMQAAFDPLFGEAWNQAQTIGMLAMPRVRLWLAERESRMCGFALTRAAADESELLMLAVAPSARGAGVGSALLDCAVECARRDGAEAVFLEVRDGNGALSLYRRYGFVQVGRRNNYYRGKNGTLHDACTYRLTFD